MKKTLLLLLCLSACLSSSLLKWKLSVKNDKVDGKAVVLIPGVFTKVTFVLENENGDNFDKSEDEQTYKFQIAVDDDRLVFPEETITLIPTSSLQFSGYIGLKCGSTIKDSKIELKFKIKAVVDGSGKDAKDQAILEFNVNTVDVSNEKTKIDLEPIMSSIPQESYSFLKLNKEPFNIDKIELESVSDQANEYLLPNVTVDKYDGKREEYSPDNNINHGILFNSKFGPKKALKDLVRKNLNVDFKFKSAELEQCFELVKKTLKIDVLEKKITELKDNIKQAIAYTLENISKKHDSTNSLNFRLNIPVAPVRVACEIRLDTNFSSDEKILNKSLTNVKASASDDIQYYNNILTSTGQATLQLGNLNAAAEYFTKCVFDTTAFAEYKKTIAVTIGNFKDSVISSFLKPSRDVNRRSQCAVIEFSSIVKLILFKNLAKRYCNWVMSKGEPLLARIFSTATSVVCEIADTNWLDNLKDKTVTICAAPSPLLNIYKYTSEDEGKKFDENFDKFIQGIKDAPSISKTLGIGECAVKSVKKYYDVVPDSSLITLSVDVGKWDLGLFAKKLTFTAVSSNDFPIECVYNDELTSDLEKKLLLSQKVESIQLQPGESKKFTVEIAQKNLEEGKSYPLYMKCYSLPGFNVRYESTEIFNPYTYYHDKDVKADVQNFLKTEVDCTKLEHKMNPRCIIAKIDSIVDRLRTDVPKFIAKIENDVQQFRTMAKEAQLKILKKLNETLKTAVEQVKNAKANFKDFIEKAVETAKYVAFKDCSIYADGKVSSEDKTIKAGLYLECRETKRSILAQIIPVIKEKLQCSTIVQTITSGLSDDPEANLKYILFLLNEVTSSPDALEKGTSQALLDISTCVNEKFNEYWPKIEKHLKEKKEYIQETVDAIKKDASTIIMQTLSNLVEALHFDEIDGYIDQTAKKVKNTGLILYDKSQKVYKEIRDFAKKLNEFGNGFYNISGSMAVDVTVAPDQFDANANAEVSIVDVEDKGIKLLLHSNYLLKEKKAYAIQSLVFDSPLMSVKASGEVDDNTVNTFVDITLYDKDGNPVEVKSLSLNDLRPTILYNKKLYKDFTKCLFYNEDKGGLSTDGVETDPNFTFEGETYIKCSSKHLTSFTIGTSGVETVDGTKWYVVLLIVLLVLALLAALVVLIITLKKKFAKPNDITTINSNSDTPILMS